MQDLVIIGGGPAGVSAGVYASRKQLKSALVTAEWGGQSKVSTDIQNWIGTPSLSGNELADNLKNHLETYAGNIVDIFENHTVTDINKNGDNFKVILNDGQTIDTKSILIASGSNRRRLEVEGADEFEHKGVTYCASCDGPMFTGKDVAVVGGGNAGFETAAQLLAYAKSVTLFHRGDEFKADPVTVEKVLQNENMKAITNSEPTKIYGDKFVTGLTYTQDGQEKELEVVAVFVEIGMVPNTDFASEVVTIDKYNRIEIDPWTQKTTTPMIWAAGDCTNIRYHQNNISAGDAVRALEDIYVTLKTQN